MATQVVGHSLTEESVGGSYEVRKTVRFSLFAYWIISNHVDFMCLHFFLCTFVSIYMSIACLGQCLNSVRKAFVALEAALLGGREMMVVKDFRCCDVPRSPEDRTELVQNMADIFMGSVQYNEEGVMLTIAQICDVMTNQSQGQTYERLVQLAAV